jgi:hypothetical protein
MAHPPSQYSIRPRRGLAGRSIKIKRCLSAIVGATDRISTASIKEDVLMNEYTVSALDSDSEQLGDALFVRSEHLGAAVDALIEYWAAEQEKVDDEYGVGVHCEVHAGSVRDGNDWKPLTWQPGDPVIDPEAERKVNSLGE